jgi:hypothetical protein
MNTVVNVNVVDVTDIGRGILIAKCADCGERVRMGRFDANYKHVVILETTYHTNGAILSQSSKHVDYCPTA